MSDNTTNEVAKTSPDMRAQRLEHLKALFPDLFDGEGLLDEKALRALITTEAGLAAERFSFDWAGKQKSKRLAFTPSRATLAYDPTRSLNRDGTENKAGETPEKNTSENLIIEGDNLEVLKLLQATYFEQVKCIYIDPPYNTGNDFIYPDNFTEGKKAYWEKNGVVKDGVKLTALPETHGRRHSDWLNFMQSRLLLARQMLREDGVIFVSIDDNEVYNLRKLMDEVFGEDNFISNLVWEKKRKGTFLSDTIASVKEYILVYSKDKPKFSGLIGEINREITTYPCINDSNKREVRKIPKGILSKFREEDYRLAAGEKISAGNMDLVLKSDLVIENSILSDDLAIEGNWRYTQEKMYEFAVNSELYITQDLYLRRIVSKPRYKVLKDLLPRVGNEGDEGNEVFGNELVGENLFVSGWGSNEEGEEVLRLLLEKKGLMSFPKPVRLVSKLISSLRDKDALIIDFFAGSGTSAHAIMQQNAEDGGNRKHIMVQIPEYTDEKSEAYKAGYKKISDITIERVKRAGAKIRAENPDAKIDTGFRVFKLTHSNFSENLFTPDEDKSDAENIKALEAHLAEAAQMRLFTEDEFSNLVTEISLKNGFGLFYQLEAMREFEHNKIHRLHGNGKSALLCLDNSLHDASVEKLKPFKDEQLIVSKSALDTSQKFSLHTEFKDNLWGV